MLLLKTLSLAAMAALATFSTTTNLKVTSIAFANNSAIPVKYSCEGEEVSPPLSISDVPTGTKSLAVIVHDPDAPKEGGFTHWVVWNINVTDRLPENFKDAEQGLNGAGVPGYKGMCPPTGTHHYHFMVYALDTRLSIDAKTDKAALEKSMQGHILAEGELVGLYKKSKP
ncbi:MAG TPA: YbhB/YbcL family Raf kinase inhibitor-like protein [Parafilimonas sp.]|nr:YbhB/YbcL family Raf kinase inhibitor-like protein [Parafilimonas sp.]